MEMSTLFDWGKLYKIQIIDLYYLYKVSVFTISHLKYTKMIDILTKNLDDMCIYEQGLCSYLLTRNN